MKHYFLAGISVIVLLMCLGCNSYKPDILEFPMPEDTETKSINLQLKTSYRFDGVYADNEFDGARMNGFRQVNDSTFRVIISPENTPINQSSYYSFRLRSEQKRKIDLEIEYSEHLHRYVPKLSFDRKHWTALDSTKFDTLKAGNLATLKLEIDEQALFVSAQELYCSAENESWIDSLSTKHEFLAKVNTGNSKLGRDIWCLDIYKGEKKSKDVIVIFGRLHPPEITGYFAMQTFVETMLTSELLSEQFLEKYRVIVYPMINPDGVDMGHWRHNAGGIDINRDWSHYRQEECKVVANHLVETTKRNKNKVILGLDFHSTQEDVYYTLTSNRKSHIFGFKDLWLNAIDNSIPGYSPNDEPYDLNQPITKGWFYLQFGAEGITYEVGDETDRAFVRQKAKVAAIEMMKLLVLR